MASVASGGDREVGSNYIPRRLPAGIAARRRRERQRQCARRRFVALLVLTATASFFGTLAVDFMRSPGGFDHHFRPNHLRSYSDPRLHFSLSYPARLTLADVTDQLWERGDIVARMEFTSRGDPVALVVTVRSWRIDRDLSRGEATKLAHELRTRVAASLPHTYQGQGGVQRVTVQQVATTIVGGLPAISSRALLRFTNGRIDTLERNDCLGPTMSFEFEAVFPVGDVGARDCFRRIVASFRQDSVWPPEGSPRAMWVMAGVSAQGASMPITPSGLTREHDEG